VCHSSWLCQRFLVFIYFYSRGEFFRELGSLEGQIKETNGEVPAKCFNAFCLRKKKKKTADEKSHLVLSRKINIVTFHTSLSLVSRKPLDDPLNMAKSVKAHKLTFARFFFLFISFQIHSVHALIEVKTNTNNKPYLISPNPTTVVNNNNPSLAQPHQILPSSTNLSNVTESTSQSAPIAPLPFLILPS